MGVLSKRSAPAAAAVERHSTAIRALCELEIEQLLTLCHLLRSYFDDDQKQTPVLQFFNENLPDLSIVKDEEDEQYKVIWKEKDGTISMNPADQIFDASLLRGLSTVYPDIFAKMSTPGIHISTGTAVGPSFLHPDYSQMKDLGEALRAIIGPGNSNHLYVVGFTLYYEEMKVDLKDHDIFFPKGTLDSVLEEPSDTHMLGQQDGLRTPGVMSSRLSFGMTPKTLRLPKPGEMLLSVHGSPLGVYNCKVDNMEAINESGEG